MRYLVCLLMAASALLSTPALAQSSIVTAPVIVAGPIVAPDPSQAETAPVALDLTALGELNGRQGDTTTVTVLTDQNLTAVNRGNTITADSVTSGQITLGAGAFQGFAGVGNFVINSGHNNNLQGALTINIVSP